MNINSKSNYKLLIFDFDGTIANTKLGIAKTINQTLEYFNYKPLALKNIYKLSGVPIIDQFREITHHALNESVYQDMLQQYRMFYSLLPMQYTTLFTKMDYVMKTLYQANLILTIASNRREESINELMKKLNISQYFSYVYAIGENMLLKPNPEISNQILNHFDINKVNCLIIGDTIYDINLGRYSNIDTCGVTFGSSTINQMKKYGPKFIINHPIEIIKILNDV